MDESSIMTTQPELPQGIGPHEGHELDLMLSGDKPLAMFCDVVPSPYQWPDAEFEPNVVSGRFVKKDIVTNAPDGKYQVRHLYYALPQEAWRIEVAHALVLQEFQTWCPEAADSCIKLGRLLGYQESDIQTFVQWVDQIRCL